jgi:hypothetical protein
MDSGTYLVLTLVEAVVCLDLGLLLIVDLFILLVSLVSEAIFELALASMDLPVANLLIGLF